MSDCLKEKSLKREIKKKTYPKTTIWLTANRAVSLITKDIAINGKEIIGKK
jgi:hypothetical protein